MFFRSLRLKVPLRFLIGAFFCTNSLLSLPLHATPPKVCMVLDKGGKNDKSFNESAVKGFEKAVKELPVSRQSKYVEPQNDAQISNFFRVFSTKADCDLIIAIGFNPAGHMAELAANHPEKKFLAIDTNLENKNRAKNIRSISFEEHEGSFLVGAIAAMHSRTGTIGFIGGMDIPLIHRFSTGYVAGAKYINPNIKIKESYVGITPEAWNNPAKAEELALSQYRTGADIIFQVAANSGQGVFDSAERLNKAEGKGNKYFVIGVDSNQNGLKPGMVLTSMLKRIDLSVYSSIQDLTEEKFTANHITIGLKQGGVDWVYDSHNKSLFTKEQLEKINKIRQDIVDGKVSVPDFYEIRKKTTLPARDQS